MIPMQYLIQSLCVFHLSTKISAQALYNQPCPVLDLNYPVPPLYATLSAIQNAGSSLHDNINRALNESTRYGQLASETNAFSVDIYSLNDQDALFTYHHTPKALMASHTVGVQSVDSDTVYRIGSVSKLYTVYLYLLAAGGDATWNQPVTRFVPELAAYVEKNKALGGEDGISVVDWDSVTIAALAGQMAGLPRDAAYSIMLEQALHSSGLPQPTRNASEMCGNGQGYGIPCSRRGFFDEYLRQHPIFAPSTTPAYSNAAFQILGYALENITGKSMPELFQEFLVQPLGLTGTSYAVPSNQNTSFIPVNASVSWWDTNLRDETPAGGYFSTINDMRKIGKSMLNSSYLTPAQTRRWMKPHAFTANPNFTVGVPWEIFRAPGDPVVWFYSKTGNLGAYAAFTALLPDFGIGMTFLASGNSAVNTVRILSDMSAEMFTPALLAASKADVISRYAGTYVDSATNSSMTIAATVNSTGLEITKWSFNGIQVTALLGALLQVNQTIQNLSIILYPSGLTSNNGSTASWRATFQVLPRQLDPGAFSTNCVSWANLNSYTYGGVGLDEFEFTLSNNEAINVQPRVVGGKLARNLGVPTSRLSRIARQTWS